MSSGCLQFSLGQELTNQKAHLSGQPIVPSESSSHLELCRVIHFTLLISLRTLGSDTSSWVKERYIYSVKKEGLGVM